MFLSHSHTLLYQIIIGEILHTRPIAKGSRCDISAKSMSIGSLDLNLTYINHRNLITGGGTGLENYPISNRLFWFLSKIFLIFIYTKWVYILKPCVGRNFSQKLIAGGDWNKNVLAGKSLKKQLGGRRLLGTKEWCWSPGRIRWRHHIISIAKCFDKRAPLKITCNCL